jgi:hypothetical protein
MENDTTASWDGDLLGVTALGETFTKLIQSIDDAKVISIEAGFGRGKTFFRERWAQHLQEQGEVVIQIDAQQSDHSGDPVVTFLGALMAALPQQQRSIWMKGLGTGKKMLWGSTKLAASVLARKAGEEGVEAIEDWLAADGDKGAIDEMVAAFSKEASKALGAQVSAQLSAEHVRQHEMPAQLAELRDALTKDATANRVGIIIDELDRCHPDYAIALLEAMKLVFDQDGYVFVLMVNDEYLENLAAHRFGAIAEGERYLDKFIDIRLSLPVTDAVIGGAARALALKLPLAIPFGDDPAFSVAAAADLAAELAPVSKLSMRQIKAVLLKVEVALRCYSEVPLDTALLVFISFRDVAGKEKIGQKALSRSTFTPSQARRWDGLHEKWIRGSANVFETLGFFHRDYMEMLPARSRGRGTNNIDAAHDLIELCYVGQTYIPTHQAVLDAVHTIQQTDATD